MGGSSGLSVTAPPNGATRCRHSNQKRTGAMLPARTYSISISRDWEALYEAIWRPEVFPKWATGLAESDLRQEDDKAYRWSGGTDHDPLHAP
jgi:hypothetical protein